MKTKMKIQEYLKRILCTVMLIVLFFPALKSNATVSQEDAGAAIASFAIDFYNKYGTRVHWYDVDFSDPSSYGLRAAAYNEATVGSMQDYYMDCVGWVSYAIHHATGLDDPGAKAGTGSFVAPDHGGTYFSAIGDGEELKPGDILANSHHVMIYVGNNRLIDSRSRNGLTYTTLEEYGNINGNKAAYGPGKNGVYDHAYRINMTGSSSINEGDLVSIISGLDSDSEKRDYNYYGLPTKGGYTGSSGTLSKLKAIINVLSQIADYLIGLMTLGIKIQLIGWTTLIENIITDLVNEVTGTELAAATDGADSNPGDAESTESTESSENSESSSSNDQDSLYTPDAKETVVGFFTDKNDRLTVEKIIYNQVPIFDVNIFNLEEAGGQKLKPDGTLATIKSNIAKWYYVFRNISIIALLIVLIYIGIRMAISTAASEKAVYKRYLKDWIVSFIIVFCIHYVMVFILNVNQYLVELMKNSSPNSEYFLYETVRTKAYELKFTSGIAGTIMYMVLVYLLVRYIFIYMKRYLTINILAVIAPIIGITYSVDKIKDNKSQSLGAWLKDFTFTTLLQTIHALLYTMFIPIALETSEDNIGGIIFSFILLNFMAKADKIVTHIFGMTGGKALSNIMKGDGMKQMFATFASFKFVGKFYATGARLAGGVIKGVGTTAAQIGGIVIPEHTRYRFNAWYNDTADKLLGENNFIDKRRTNNIKTTSGIDSKLKAKKLEYRKALKTQISAPFKFVKTGVKFTLGAMVAIPALVISPSEGIKTAIKAYGTMKLLNANNEKTKLKAPRTGRGSLNNIVAERTTGKGDSKTNNQNNARNNNRGIRIGLTANVINQYRNARNNSLETSEKLDGRFTKSIAMLEEAKALEEKIILGYASVVGDINERFGITAPDSNGSNTPSNSGNNGRRTRGRGNTQYNTYNNSYNNFNNAANPIGIGNGGSTTSGANANNTTGPVGGRTNRPGTNNMSGAGNNNTANFGTNNMSRAGNNNTATFGTNNMSGTGNNSTSTFGTNNMSGTGNNSTTTFGTNINNGTNLGIGNNNSSNGATTAASRVSQVLATKLDEQYDKMIEEIFKEVDVADINAVVEKYVEDHKTTRIEPSEIGSIVTLLQERLDKKDKENNQSSGANAGTGASTGTATGISSDNIKKIKITNDATDNIEEVISENVDAKLVKGIETELKKHNITWDEVDQSKQIDIAKDIEMAFEKTSDPEALLDALNKSLITHKVSARLNDTVKKDIIKNITRRLENQKDKAYTPTEIVGILKKGLSKKGSIKKEEVPTDFKGVAEDIERLKELNSRYEKEFGQTIFTKDEIVKAMKETKRAKKFDLYESIINGEE